MIVYGDVFLIINNNIYRLSFSLPILYMLLIKNKNRVRIKPLCALEYSVININFILHKIV